MLLKSHYVNNSNFFAKFVMMNQITFKRQFSAFLFPKHKYTYKKNYINEVKTGGKK